MGRYNFIDHGWYRFSQTAQSIEDIATQVRTQILKAEDSDTLQALCLPVSRHLAQVLIDNGYKAAQPHSTVELSHF